MSELTLGMNRCLDFHKSKAKILSDFVEGYKTAGKLSATEAGMLDLRSAGALGHANIADIVSRAIYAISVSKQALEQVKVCSEWSTMCVEDQDIIDEALLVLQ